MGTWEGGVNLKVYSILAWRLNGIAAATGLFCFWAIVLLGGRSREIEAKDVYIADVMARHASTFLDAWVTICLVFGLSSHLVTVIASKNPTLSPPLTCGSAFFFLNLTILSHSSVPLVLWSVGPQTKSSDNGEVMKIQDVMLSD